MEQVRARRFTAMAAALSCCLGLPCSVQAASPSSEATSSAEPNGGEELQQIYDRALQLYGDEDYEAAIEAFQEAYEIEPEPNLIYNIYRCYERLDRLDEALKYLDQYIGSAPDSELDELGTTRTSLVDRMGGEPVAQQPPSSTSTDAPPEKAADRPGKRDRIYGPASWALTGVAAVGLGIGIGFIITAAGHNSDADDDCADTPSGRVCGAAGTESLDKAQTHEAVSYAGFGVAGAAAIAVVTIVAIKASRKKKQSTATLAPYGDGRNFGLSFSARF